MLNILALGDAHFQTSNLKEINFFLDKLNNFLKQESNDIDIICIMGDILHDHARLHVTPLNKAIEYVNLCATYKPTYVIVGNHDAEFNSIFLTDNHWLNCLKNKTNIQVIDTLTVHEIKGHKLVFCPYVPDGRFVEALNTKKGQWEDAKCIFSHVTIKDCKMGSLIAKDADEWKDEYPLLVSGHIHGSQWVTDNMFYTGSILQVAVDEDPDKIIALISIDKDGLPEIQEIDLELPKKKILHVDISEIDDYKVPNEPNTTYSLYISGSYDDFKAFRKGTKYRDLQKLPQIGSAKNIKFQATKDEKKEKIRQIEDLQKVRQKHFTEMLLENIKLEKDQTQVKLMLSLYNSLLDNSDDISEDLENLLII